MRVFTDQTSDSVGSPDGVREIEIDTVLPSHKLASLVGVREKKQRILQRQERARLGHDALPFSLETIAALIAAGVRVRIRLFPVITLCGARTRKGHPCRCRALKNGRCRLHGGLSTGPKTEGGWARTRAGYVAWVDSRRQERRASHAPPVEKT